jgi:hypothetical protein
MAADWNAKEVIDQTTGKVHRLYTYKRKPCFRRVLNSHLAKQLAGYVLIEKDLRTVGVWLNELDSLHTDGPTRKGEHYKKGIDREKYNIVKGLFVAALTFYGKCFSKCEGRPVKLERAQLDKKFLILHDECISYRHNFAAHSGAAKLEYVEIAVVFPQKPKLGTGPKIYRELFQPDFISPSSPDDVSFNALVEHVKTIVDAKINRLHEKIMKEEVLPMGFDYWKRKK